MGARAVRTVRSFRSLSSLSQLAAVVVTVATAAIAACGPPAEPLPKTPSAGGSQTVPPPGTGTSVPTATPTEQATRPPTPGVPTKPIAPSAMEAELREIGLDPRDLPPLNKMEPAMLRKVMKPFAKSLGVQCSHCHDTKSFKAPTPNKKIATHMWNDFVRALAMQDGSPLFCDSCHQGKAVFLDRSPALAEYMKENFVDKLSRSAHGSETDKKDHGCPTCHGEPFEGKILTKLWK